MQTDYIDNYLFHSMYKSGLDKFKKYRRTNIAEMRLYIFNEDLKDVSVSREDLPPLDMGMVARNPENHKDQWYVARKYFEDNFEEIK